MQSNFITPYYFYFGHPYPMQPHPGHFYLPPIYSEFPEPTLQQASTPKDNTGTTSTSPIVKLKQQEEQNSIKEEKQDIILQKSENKSTEKKQRQKRKSKKCQDYIPYQSSKKSKKRAYQNEKRNIMPNIVHQIFCFIQNRKKCGMLVQQYLNTQDNITDPDQIVQRFFSYQKLIKEKTNHYMNEKGIIELNKIQQPKCLLFSLKEQQMFIKINRVLARYFLKNQIEPVILTSVRMKNETRIWHLELKRRLMENLLDLMNDF